MVEALIPGDPPTVGPYRLLARLGSGGMGQVFLGRSGTGRMVAVKVVHGELAQQPHFRRRFRSEVEAARRVGGLWTAPVLEADTESPVPWVATGYVVGSPLRQIVDTLHGPLAEHSVWALALGLSRALREVHDSGLIHRDLKPSNVMVTLEGPKVIDFGIARAVDASVVTRTGAMVGSPGYMPPEQIRGEEMTAAVDVFALGAVLAYAATGAAPFSWDGAQVHTVLYRVLHDPPQLGPADGPLRGELRELVARCLAKEAGRRPGLAEIEPLATEGAGTQFWLPPLLTAQLGQSAAELLAYDGPPSEGTPASWGSRQPPSAPSPDPGSVQPGQTTYASEDYQGSTPQYPALAPRTPPPPARPARPAWRRGRPVLAAASAVVAMALTAWLVVAIGDGGNGTPQSGDTGGAAGGAAGGADGGGDGGQQAPLADLVPQAVREEGGITVHVHDEHDPLAFRDEEGEWSGFEVDLIEAIGNQLGVRTDYVEEQGREEAAKAAVSGGTAHIAVGDIPDNADDRRSLRVDFVNHFWNGLAVMSDDPTPPTAWEDLCGLTLVSYAGTDEDSIKRHTGSACAKQVKPETVDGRREMADAVASGQADAAVVLYSLAAAHVVKDPRMHASPLVRGSRGIAVPQGQEELRTALVSATQALLDDGSYQRLLQHWHIPDAAIDKADYNVGGG